jgi:hypothetical protein
MIAFADLDLMDDASLCRGSKFVTLLLPALRECSPSIPGFHVYIAFYSIPLIIFLVLRTLPIDTIG